MLTSCDYGTSGPTELSGPEERLSCCKCMVAEVTKLTGGSDAPWPAYDIPYYYSVGEYEPPFESIGSAYTLGAEDVEVLPVISCDGYWAPAGEGDISGNVV